jgi:hypothetical protein
MQLFKKHILLFLCIASFFAAFTYNEINLKELSPDNKREGITVVTADDDSYLTPAINYYNESSWYEYYYGGKIGYFIRPPGYGILYYIFLTISSSKIIALIFLKYFQLLLFSISVYWFYYICQTVFKNEKLSLLLSAIYGLSPFFVGFLFYTLSEGISPALVLAFLFLLFKAKNANASKTKNIFYLLASIVFAYLFIVRPFLGLFGLLIPLFIYFDYKNTSVANILKRCFIFCTVAISLMSVWQIRNFRIAGKFVGFHPIYFEDGNTVFRAPFREYWNFAGGWAERGDRGYSYMLPVWGEAVNGDTSITLRKNAIDSIPIWVVNYFGEERLNDVFLTYQKSILVQKQFLDKNLPMPLIAPEIEIEAINKFQSLTSDFKKHFWFQYYIVSPLKVFRLMAFHSNLSLYIFQRTYRGLILMELVRLLFFSIHVLCFLFLIANIYFMRKQNELYYALVLLPFIYVFYLCFFQRGIEERYTLPILPLLLIGLSYSAYRFLNWVFTNFNIGTRGKN